MTVSTATRSSVVESRAWTGSIQVDECLHGDDSKCRTYGDDCWGAQHEPKECADGYRPVVDWQDSRLYCFPQHCDMNHYMHASCSHDEGKCNTDGWGGDCYGAIHEPKECSDGYRPVVDFWDDRLYCYPQHCGGIESWTGQLPTTGDDPCLRGDDSKCRTHGEDCWGATHEPKECADGYRPVVDWQDDRLYCFPTVLRREPLHERQLLT
eukprot:TRINITY_DN3226_c0_g1_i2.p1 TRINITY_DN3226_c0_g1~~TRINITY_DN3226_c0_g1_i2.p1  ORF type:complete len:209 (+),score=26.15 TRINITY_DN3226_c0_g1_i2:182-808(+)